MTPRLPANTIKGFARENTSGTRMTYVVDIMRISSNPGAFLGEDVGNNSLGSTSSSRATSTGNMLSRINGDGTFVGLADNAYGYAFVTGTAGDSKPNIRVAAYNGVFPFRKDPTLTTPNFVDLSGGSVSLPAGTTANKNNGQISYAEVGTKPYYTETINGRYPLWAVANAYTTTDQGGVNASNIFSSILSDFQFFPNVAYSQGLVLLSDL